MTTIKAMRLASVVTAINVLVASGFSIVGIIHPQYLVPAGSVPTQASLILAMYAAARTIPLALFALWAIYTLSGTCVGASWVRSPSAACNCWMPESVCLTRRSWEMRWAALLQVLNSSWYMCFTDHGAAQARSVDSAPNSGCRSAPDCRREIRHPIKLHPGLTDR